MAEFFKINGHGHLLPYPEQIPAFMKEKKIFWLDDDRQFMRQGDWKRPITDASFFLDEKLIWMKKNNIEHAVILNLSQLYCNGMEEAISKDVLQFQNDFNAGIQSSHPSKFTTGFVVQPAFVDQAIAEIKRCVQEHNLSLLCLPTHFLNADQQWTSVASPEVEPIWELANELEIAVEIHPYDGPRMINLKDQHWRFHLVWMCAQTADTFHAFTLQNYPEKYPNVRTCFAHGNQYGQINIGRRTQGFNGRPDLFEGTVNPSSNFQTTNVFCDTLVHDLPAFRLLVERQTASQLVAGLDDPYPLGEMENVPNSYPGKVIEEGLQAGVITSEQRNDIWHSNVLNWLYGVHKNSFYKRIEQ